jgi:hypothetical protein
MWTIRGTPQNHSGIVPNMRKYYRRWGDFCSQSPIVGVARMGLSSPAVLQKKPLDNAMGQAKVLSEYGFARARVIVAQSCYYLIPSA